MKISVNWLKDFIEVPQNTAELADKLTFGGLEVENVETFESVKGGLKGIVIGEVKYCEKHPNADRLSITKVDIGAEELQPIVCGAPNVAIGQKVLVATVGAILYPSKGDSFTIQKAKIRGEVSEGMICAEDELGLGESHDGILVLNTDLPNGTPAAHYFNLYSDQILEIGLTPNRGDAASHLGVARDIRALFSKNIKSTIPEALPVKSDYLELRVNVENPEACPRYAGIVLSGIKVKESPLWLQNRLKSIGLKPINNVVDTTNFILHDLGQPLHAFDYGKINGKEVLVKTGLKGSKFISLDKEERTLHEDDLMICDKNGPMCIGGVFGGIDSGVSESTTSIFLESACFDPVFIRKSSQRHGLKTDAAFRFERGTDIDLVINALKKAVKILVEVADAKVASDLFDIYPKPKDLHKVELPKKDIKRIIGVDIPDDRVLSILNSLDISLLENRSESWLFQVPNYRTEVTRPADLIEEILRIHGFNNIPLEKNSGTSYLAPFDYNDATEFENLISDFLIGRNFNEIQTNSLGKPGNSLLSDYFETGTEKVEILNKLSEDLGVMRDNLMSSSMEVLRHNINRKQNNLRLFEFGFIYGLDKEKFLERRILSLTMTGLPNEENWMMKAEEQSFFNLLSVVNGICDRVGMVRPEIRIANKSFLQSGGFEFYSKKKLIGMIGSVKRDFLKEFELSQNVWYSDLFIDELIALKEQSVLFKEIPKFPEVRRDLSLVLNNKIRYEEILNIALISGGNLLQDVRVFDVFEGKPLEENQKSYALSFILQDAEGTLDDKKIDKLMNSLILKYEKDLGAIIRR